MPNIYDNIEAKLVDGLRRAAQGPVKCSFCVGYLNLRGWNQLVEVLGPLAEGDERSACRVLVGMYRPPEEATRLLQSPQHVGTADAGWPQIDGPTAALLKRRITEGFKKQLEFGVPSNEAERALRQLAEQLRSEKVRIKAFLRYPLHAKLYLVERNDHITPLIGFVGSSNLTLAGLLNQGELNVDVVEQDAARKLQQWFDDRWNDSFAFDLTTELADLIENSWACRERIRPYLVYLRIAYHLSEDARLGEAEFKIPSIFRDVLLDFQKAAVLLGARKLYRHGGVLLGDVVGLGKTLMATAIARVMQEDNDDRSLVICPPKLAPMWENCLHKFGIVGKVLSLGRTIDALPNLPRYRLVIIDESHNLRNREGKHYRAIREYIERNESRVLLLTATPYNKHYTDISNQLRLFLDEDQELHIRPERYLQSLAPVQQATFLARFHSSLRAFEQSPFAQDWQDLMRLFLVRRTRQFIIKHYAKFDEQKGRYYVWLNGAPQYFPLRQPKRVDFALDESDPNDQYARLFRNDVVAVIENLELPRYGLANYLVGDAERLASDQQKRILQNLNRAGKRLIGFCRTNLFKRLESSGHSFLLSVRRHIVRNLVTLYALEKGLPVPIGTQDVAMLDTAVNDTDQEFAETANGNDSSPAVGDEARGLEQDTWSEYSTHAEKLYQVYNREFRNRFDWLDAKFFTPALAKALRSDAQKLLRVLERAGDWDPSRDAKLDALMKLLTQRHPDSKVLVFTQFADTALYLEEQLRARGVRDIAVLTNQFGDPVTIARRFSPSTNDGLPPGETELRVLVATDVLAEGQNLQDAHIVVNYDLPWAIVRLIQRAGRVDRIGQKHDTIYVYSFWPAEGIERIIELRRRLVHRLEQNQEVVGTDDSFFGEQAAQRLYELYTEKSNALDEEGTDEDIDLASLALQVWNSAAAADQKAALGLPPIAAAARALPETGTPGGQSSGLMDGPPGVVTYVQFPDGTDALVRVDEDGKLVPQGLSTIFRCIACPPETPAVERTERHHELVARCVALAAEEQATLSGQLGSLRSLRRKLWERLEGYRCQLQANADRDTAERQKRLQKVLDLIWRYPLKRSAEDTIRRQLRLGIADPDLVDILAQRAAEGALCEVKDEESNEPPEPRVICSLGLVKATTTP